MIYFDASYLVRLYYNDRGYEEVRHLASTDSLACAQHGQAEVIAAFHRKYREGSLTLTAYQSVLQQFTEDIHADAFRWLPLSPTILDRIRLDFDERTGFLIDQTPYAIDETGYSVTRGAREVWEIKNSPISMPHPMHVHGFGFRVLRRQGTFGAARKFATEPGGRFPTDLGIKDTVLAWPNETLWLALDFTLPRDAAFGGPQRYMFHCHNLEHEDAMMMRNITVL